MFRDRIPQGGLNCPAVHSSISRAVLSAVVFHGSVPDWSKAHVPIIILTVRAELLLHFSKISLHLSDKGKEKTKQNKNHWLQDRTFSSGFDKKLLTVLLPRTTTLSVWHSQWSSAWQNINSSTTGPGAAGRGQSRFKQVPSILSLRAKCKRSLDSEASNNTFSFSFWTPAKLWDFRFTECFL